MYGLVVLVIWTLTVRPIIVIVVIVVVLGFWRTNRILTGSLFLNPSSCSQERAFKAIENRNAKITSTISGLPRAFAGRLTRLLWAVLAWFSLFLSLLLRGMALSLTGYCLCGRCAIAALARRMMSWILCFRAI